MFGGKLPFVGRLFWTILPIVFVVAFLTFFIAIRFFDYKLTNADIGGSIISGLILSYLIHLWLLPAEHLPDDESSFDPDADSSTGMHEPPSSEG